MLVLLPPVFVIVTVCVLLDPTTIFPKFTLGTELSCRGFLAA